MVSLQEYEGAFKNYDINGDGVISVDELRLLLERVGLRPSEVLFEELFNIVSLETKFCRNSKARPRFSMCSLCSDRARLPDSLTQERQSITLWLVLGCPRNNVRYRYFEKYTS